MSDIAASVKEEAARRMKSPFVGAYVLSWCALNYEFLIVVFSAGDYTDKIGYIARHLYVGIPWWWTFGVPVVFALGSVAILPLLNAAVDVWLKRVEVGRMNWLARPERGKRLSELELRAALRAKTSEVDALRRYAATVIQEQAALTYKAISGPLDTKPLTPRKLGKLSRRTLGLTASLESVLAESGLPSIAYRMLKLLIAEGALDEDRLLRDGGASGQQNVGRQCLAFLLGAELIRMAWNEGVLPKYEVTKAGKTVVNAVAQDYSELTWD